MEIGKLLRCKKGRIDISEIPFRTYLDRNIQLQIIEHDQINGKKYGDICTPFGRSVYSIMNKHRIALSHYTDLQEHENIQKMIKAEKLPEIKCGCKESEKDGQYFGLTYENTLGEDLEDREEFVEELQLPELKCRYCVKIWGELPQIILDIYFGIGEMKGFGVRKENELIVPPNHEGLVWVMFNDAHLDWERDGLICIR